MKLYDFQVEGIKEASYKTGFLNACSMGTGKTVMALAELWEAEWDRVLIVTTKSARSVWEDHVRYLLQLNPYILTTQNVEEIDRDFDKGIVITNWDALARIPWLAMPKRKWDFVIADEIHAIKNRKTKRAKALKKIPTKFKRGLSGTPIVNRPDELWSILNWLYPKEFRSYWRFFGDFVKYEEHPRYGYKIFIAPKNSLQLKELLKPIMYRKTKEEVLPQLPRKYTTNVDVDLHPKQRKAYDEMKKYSLAWLEQFPDDKPLPAPTILAQLTRLRQFAVAYAKMDEDGSVKLEEPSSKLDAMMELIDSAGQQPLVIFTQFKGLLNLVRERLENSNISFVSMDGSTKGEDRGEFIERFQKGHVQVFACTTGTGGIGVTLHRASTVVFLDRAWSPAMNLQAEDRLHRIGQRNSVQIINIRAKDTIDSVVEERLELKAKWAREVLGG